MKRIDIIKTTAIFRLYLTDPHKTVPLEDLCEAFELSIKDDSEVIFKILNEHLFYSDKPQSASNKFAWHVDKEGFHILGDYAKAKQECLSTFQNLYLAGYIKSTQPKKSEFKGGINAKNNQKIAANFRETI